MSTFLSTSKTIWPDNINTQMIKHTYIQIWSRDGRQVNLVNLDHQIIHGVKERKAWCSILTNKSHCLVGPIHLSHLQVKSCKYPGQPGLPSQLPYLPVNSTTESPHVDADTSPRQNIKEQWEMNDTGCSLVHQVQGRLTKTVRHVC